MPKVTLAPPAGYVVALGVDPGGTPLELFSGLVVAGLDAVVVLHPVVLEGELTLGVLRLAKMPCHVSAQNNRFYKK